MVNVPTDERFAAARQSNRYNIILDELNEQTTLLIESFCLAEKVVANLELDVNSFQYRISIFTVTFEFVEKLEMILSRR